MVRVGRWIACPDIETQFAPDNYMGTHSLLFTFDTYTQTGVMATFKLNDNWMVQGAILFEPCRRVDARVQQCIRGPPRNRLLPLLDCSGI